MSMSSKEIVMNRNGIEETIYFLERKENRSEDQVIRYTITLDIFLKNVYIGEFEVEILQTTTKNPYCYYGIGSSIASRKIQ